MYSKFMSVISCHTFGHWLQPLVGKSLDFLPKGWCKRPLVHINEIDGSVTFTECLWYLRGLDRPNHYCEETYPTPLYESDKTEKWAPSRESNPGPSTFMVNALTTELLDWAGNVTRIDVCPFLQHPWLRPQSLVGKFLDFLPKGMVLETSSSYK